MTIESNVASWTEQLAAAEQAAQVAAQNKDLTPAAQQAAAQKVREAARSDVLSSAAALVEQTEKAFVAADAQAREWDADFEDHHDFARLGVALVEVAAQIRGARTADAAKAAVDNVLAGQNYYEVRALRSAVPDLTERMLALGVSEASVFGNLDKRIADKLAALEPATLRTSKALAQSRYNDRHELRVRLSAMASSYAPEQRPWPALRELLGRRSGIFG